MKINQLDAIRTAEQALHSGSCSLTNRDDIIDHYVMNELTDASREAFDEHCFNCDACFHALQAREELVHLLKSEGRTLFAEMIAPKKRTKFSLRDWLDRLLQPGRFGAMEWAFAAAATLVVIVGTTFLFRATQQQDILADIRFDAATPHVFEPAFGSTFRASGSEHFADFADFRNSFLAAMRAYNALQYSRAIDILATLQPQAELLQNSTSNDTVRYFIRDYYFYFGSAHLALARTDTQNFDQSARQAHLNAAIDNLRKANEMTAQYALPQADRGHYFLGLAYGFLGQKQPAILAFEQIDTDSEFYQMSQKILRQWAQ